MSVFALRAFLYAADTVALVEVVRTRGSVPREAGTFMLVSRDAAHGTIGGGQLEYMAIDKARQMLPGLPSPLRGGSDGEAKRGGGRGAALDSAKTASSSPPPPGPAGHPPRKGEGKRVMLDIPLGPEIGQCCGGRVEVSIRLADERLKAELVDAVEREERGMPHVYIFGGGHVGQALAASVALLPVHAIVVETRAEALEGMPAGVEMRLAPLPEEIVRTAPAGSAFVVLTHDHALDFLIVAEALRRDAAYVGMIGSKTKKATFRNWFLKSADGTEARFARLVSPIGGNAVKDKRPAVIAALAAAEIMTALAAHAGASVKVTLPDRA